MPGANFCETHRDAFFGLEIDALAVDACPRCGLQSPEGLHLHRCSRWRRKLEDARLLCLGRHAVDHHTSVETDLAPIEAGVSSQG